ncbi:biotin transporter BioY [Rhodobacteraceae bacterium N5(2021)]|uniref:Biotin transporter n=1 Tax=Gymnodinialimonas phycosphaerae TaxID=2841589 RepID=A0A975TX51_9RHOB|nr:biotin transporter BioY [Gymnodinialimonas phycosphaerae]MBY4891521.1 biotin transporter BioY [Gymnodinialimonas phycosphaerae]
MGGNATLLSATLGQEGLVRKALLVLGGTILIALAARTSVPMFPVPMSLQTLAILAVGFSFGSRLGAITVLAYLAQGFAGLPVFTPSTMMGPLAFAGPTAGFLLGFVAMAWAAGFAAERGLARGFLGTAVAGIVISALLYVPGIAWPMAVASVTGIEAGWVGQGFGYYWTYFISSFLIGDAVKAILAALVVTGGWAALARR